MTSKREVGFTRIGLGVMGDSSYFGVTGLLQPEDKILYGASYTMTDFDVTEDGASAEDKAKWETLSDDSDYSQIVVGVGYGVGGFSVELDVEQKMAAGKIFMNSDSAEGKEDSAFTTYLRTYYSF